MNVYLYKSVSVPYFHGDVRIGYLLGTLGGTHQGLAEGDVTRPQSMDGALISPDYGVSTAVYPTHPVYKRHGETEHVSVIYSRAV